MPSPARVRKSAPPVCPVAAVSFAIFPLPPPGIPAGWPPPQNAVAHGEPCVPKAMPLTIYNAGPMIRLSLPSMIIAMMEYASLFGSRT